MEQEYVAVPTEPGENAPKVPQQGKKLFGIVLGIIIGAACLVFVVVLIVSLASSNTGRVQVGGTWYNYSAESGIENFSDIENGVYWNVMGSLRYAEEGADEWTETSPLRDTPMALIYGSNELRNFEEYEVACYTFMFAEDFKTGDGITDSSSEQEIEQKGYFDYGLFATPNGYCQFYTEDAVLDWDAIADDMELLEEENDFDELDYGDYIGESSLDFWRFAVRDGIDSYMDYDDVLEFLEDDMWEDYGSPEEIITSQLAFAKLFYLLEEGEIDYFIINDVRCNEDGNVLTVRFYVKEDTSEDWYENMGAGLLAE